MFIDLAIVQAVEPDIVPDTYLVALRPGSDVDAYVGMSPRQVMVMVAASAAPLAIIAGALAIPAGIGLDRIFFNILGSTAGGNDIPPAVYQVFAAWELVAIAVTGVAVAVAAALIPGRWAARSNVVAALHAE